MIKCKIALHILLPTFSGNVVTPFTYIFNSIKNVFVEVGGMTGYHHQN